MPDDRTAREIEARFRNELEYIEGYVHLLCTKLTVHDRQVMDLNSVLARVPIKLLPIRRYDRAGESYSVEEMKLLLGAIVTIEPEIYQAILDHERRLNDFPSFTTEGPAAEYMERLYEWVDYLMPRLSDDPENDEVKNVLRNAMAEAQTVDQDLEEEERIPPNALRALLTIAVDHAQYAKVQQRVDAMVYASAQFEEIKVLARVATPDAEIGVYRQGFVLLMTAFDAAVFDLIRIGLRRRFFPLIGEFGKQEKYTLESLADAGSFETFRDRLIDEQLKKRYLKDVLGLLQAFGVQCVDESQNDRPV